MKTSTFLWMAIFAMTVCGVALGGCTTSAPPQKTDRVALPAALSSSPRSPGTLATQATAAVWDGGHITGGELAQQTAAEVAALDAEYKRRRHRIEKEAAESLLDARLLELAAAERGITVEALEATFTRAVKVNAGEIRAVYEQALSDEEVPFEEARPVIEHELRQKRAFEAREALLTSLHEAKRARITVASPPAVAINLDGRPSRGKADAAMTLVLFEDFECPYCADTKREVDALLAAFPKDLRVVFMHYPLSFHAAAKAAAVAAECAHRQGKFWEMHDQLFAHHDRLKNSKEAMAVHARAVGIAEVPFLACVSGAEAREAVEDDIDQGDEIGVEGTPAVWLNGVLQEGLPTASELRSHLRNRRPG